MGPRIIVEPNSNEGHYIKAERFTKGMVEVWRYVNKKGLFTASEEKTLHRLSMFLQINTNAIVAQNGDYMGVEKMAEETGIDRSNIRKVVKLLIKKNALGTWRSGDYEIYYMNPFLYQMGNVPPYLFNLFDAEFHRKAKTDHNLIKFKAGKKITSIVVDKTENTKKKASAKVV